MMLSPALGLLYFFGKAKDGVGGEQTKFGVKDFIGLALVPVYVSAALSFGLIFLFVASTGISDNVESVGKGTEKIELSGLTLTITGYQGKTADGFFKASQGALSSLIVELFGIVILWVAVMAALKQSDVTKNIVQPIESF